MELDTVGANESQILPLEDETEMVDIGDLDIFTLEQACKKKDFDQISEKQIENLTAALARAQQHQKSLSI